MRRKLLTVLGLVAVALVETGCFIAIDKVDDPTAAFQKARAEADRYAGRRGPAHQLNLLVWDKNDAEMVRISLPMWVVKKLDDAEMEWNEHDGRDTDSDRERDVARRIRKHVRARDLDKAGLGILLEVEEDEGDRVLVWLR
jgi:hypothetical protein